MNASTMARTAYSAARQGSARTPRSTEYALLAKVTALLKETDRHDALAFPALAQAIEQNRKLWLRFALDVAHPDNELPRDLRARIFYLYEIVQQHSARVLAHRADTGLLVDINRAVMRGLAGQGGGS
ncbi:flagellar biosynthesis regulator FlaF [Cereibacter sphaeroides]|nr:flagellar biosynthesis regulator FlaF [Cereibacter sphaeroides]MCE8421305.1 flagellar biosynthesis regulator FlaF [Rhodovulum sulfidophilum]ACM04345.1 FlaF protein [Cereibacter sphaeroides KD131]AMJ49913.1 flagellar biosynthesis regulator FlhF [Cereibacter sphaeroides]ANS36635.1 flagellar biosynthesis regulator FlhF [Cereibacter sphaeroides]ATN65686.1 flagellar biosynthesis regulator FlhF [Cereibacter sphaeroides]